MNHERKGHAAAPLPDLPPHSKEAECSVLGCLLRDNGVFGIVDEILRAADFYQDASQKTYRAFADLHRDGKPVNQWILADELHNRGQLDDIGGASYIGQLFLAEPTGNNAEYYARKIKDFAARRELIRIAERMKGGAQNPSGPTAELLESSEADLAALRTAGIGGAADSPLFTAADLADETLPEQRWAVEGILPEGLSILAGKPKLGKSWAALNIAIAVATGGVALGAVHVEQGDVLYLALEDTKRRLQDRVKKLMCGGRASERLTFAIEHRRQDKGGLAALTRWLEAHPEARLVAVDTWGKFKPSRKKGANEYEEDYQHLGELKKVADKAGVAVLLVFHCRKTGATDPIEEVNGSVGQTGAADCIMVLKRDRGQGDAVLHVTGRDVEEQEFALKWDAAFCQWSIIGQADEYRLTKERAEVVEILRKAARPMRPNEVTAASGKKLEAVKSLLWRMERDNQLTVSDGHYFIISSNPSNQRNSSNLSNCSNLSNQSVAAVAEDIEESNRQCNRSKELFG